MIKNFPTGKYDTIYVDPPWPIKKIKRKVRPNQVNMDYPVMTLDEISGLPIQELASENCVLFLWTIQKFLPNSFGIMEDWGFKYQRTITLDKKNGMCLFGFHHRTEFLLFGYVGKLEMYPRRKAFPTLVPAKSTRHSAKPQVIREWIEPFGEKRIELFAREITPGWDAWGDEIEGFMHYD